MSALVDYKEQRWSIVLQNFKIYNFDVLKETIMYKKDGSCVTIEEYLQMGKNGQGPLAFYLPEDLNKLAIIFEGIPWISKGLSPDKPEELYIKEEFFLKVVPYVMKLLPTIQKLAQEIETKHFDNEVSSVHFLIKRFFEFALSLRDGLANIEILQGIVEQHEKTHDETEGKISEAFEILSIFSDLFKKTAFIFGRKQNKEVLFPVLKNFMCTAKCQGGNTLDFLGILEQMFPGLISDRFYQILYSELKYIVNKKIKVCYPIHEVKIKDLKKVFTPNRKFNPCAVIYLRSNGLLKFSTNDGDDESLKKLFSFFDFKGVSIKKLLPNKSTHLSLFKILNEIYIPLEIRLQKLFLDAGDINDELPVFAKQLDYFSTPIHTGQGISLQISASLCNSSPQVKSSLTLQIEDVGQSSNVDIPLVQADSGAPTGAAASVKKTKEATVVPESEGPGEKEVPHENYVKMQSGSSIVSSKEEKVVPADGASKPGEEPGGDVDDGKTFSFEGNEVLAKLGLSPRRARALSKAHSDKIVKLRNAMQEILETELGNEQQRLLLHQILEYFYRENNPYEGVRGFFQRLYDGLRDLLACFGILNETQFLVFLRKSDELRQTFDLEPLEERKSCENPECFVDKPQEILNDFPEIKKSSASAEPDFYPAM